MVFPSSTDFRSLLTPTSYRPALPGPAPPPAAAPAPGGLPMGGLPMGGSRVGGIAGDLTAPLPASPWMRNLQDFRGGPSAGTQSRITGYADDPLGGGLAQRTLDSLLSTGLMSDTAGIEEAARTQSDLYWQDLMNQINEATSVEGLTGSSAHTGRLADAGARLSADLASTLANIQFGAEEAAAGRRAGGVDQAIRARGLGLEAILGLGGLETQGRGQDLQSILGGGDLELGRHGLTTNRLLGAGDLGIRAAPVFTAPWGMGPFSGGVGAAVSGYQKGGRVPYQDFLADLLFGQQFLSPQGGTSGLSAASSPTQASPSTTTSSGASKTSAPSKSAPLDKMQQVTMALKLLGLMSQPSPAAEGFHTGRIRATPMQRGLHLANINPTLLSLMLEGYQEGGPVGDIMGVKGSIMNTLPALSSAMGFGDVMMPPLQSTGITGPQMDETLAILATLADPSGGKVKGPKQPPDSVPIMAQGGEGVLPLSFMKELKESTSTEPLIMKMKELMGFQHGGQISTAHSNIAELLRNLEQQGGYSVAGPEGRMTIDLKQREGAPGVVPIFELQGQIPGSPDRVEEGPARPGGFEALESLTGGGGGYMGESTVQVPEESPIDKAAASLDRTRFLLQEQINRALRSGNMEEAALLTDQLRDTLMSQAQTEQTRVQQEQAAAVARSNEIQAESNEIRLQQQAALIGSQIERNIAAAELDDAQRRSVENDPQIQNKLRTLAWMTSILAAAGREKAPKPILDMAKELTQEQVMTDAEGNPVTTGAWLWEDVVTVPGSSIMGQLATEVSSALGITPEQLLEDTKKETGGGPPGTSREERTPAGRVVIPEDAHPQDVYQMYDNGDITREQMEAYFQQ